MVLSYRRCFNEGCETFADQYCVKDEGFDLKRWPESDDLITELRAQLRLIGPLTALNLMWIGRFTVCILFLVYLGGLELEGGVLALTYANLTGFSILIGLSGGLESLISQAFGAQRQDVLVSSLYRGVLLLLLASVPSGFAWLGVQTFLLHLGYSSSVAAVSYRFLLYLLPDLALQAVLYPVGVFLRCQLNVRSFLVFSSLGFLLHVVLCFIFVAGLSLKGAGTAFAMCVSDSVVLLLLLVSLFIDNNGQKDSEENLIETSTNSKGPLLELAFPSCMAIWLEWWSFEIIVLLNGLLKNPGRSFSTAAIVLNSDTIFYVVQMALASCACTRVGKELGSNSPTSAYHAAVTSLMTSTMLGFASFICMAALGITWGRMFCSDSEVLKTVGKEMRVMGLVELVSSPLLVCSGILRGCGVPMAAAAARLVSLYVIGLPLSLVLGVVLEFGSVGLLYGLLTGVVCCAAMTGAAVCGLDWADLAHSSKQQFYDDDDEEEEELYELAS